VKSSSIDVIHDWWLGIVAHKWIMVAIFLTIVGVGMMVTLLQEPTFESTSKIIVSRDRIDPRITASDRSVEMERPDISDEEFNSELEILQSRQVIEAVVKELKMETVASSTGWRKQASDWFKKIRGTTDQAPPPQQVQIEQAIQKLRANLEVVPAKKSRVISVTYRASSPESAARVLDTLFRKYTDHQLNLRQQAEAAHVFNAQTSNFNRKLLESTDAIKRFDQANNVTNVPAQKDWLLKQYYEARNQMESARAGIQEGEQRVQTLQGQLASQPALIESEKKTVYVQALDKMKEELMTLELQQSQYRQKYKPDYRLVRETEQRITQLRDLIKREENAPPSERTTSLNEVHRRLTNDLLEAQTNLKGLREREKTSAALVAQYQSQLSKLDVLGFEKQELERVRNLNEEAYLLYQKKAREAEIVSLLNREKVVNINLVEAAGINHQPVNPKPLLNLVVLTVIGLLAAIAAATALESLNPKVRSTQALEQDFGINVLASIPDIEQFRVENRHVN